MSIPQFRLRSLPDRFRQVAADPDQLNAAIAAQLQPPSPADDQLPAGPPPISYDQLLAPPDQPQPPAPPLLTPQERTDNLAGQTPSTTLTADQINMPPRRPQPTRGRPLQFAIPSLVNSAGQTAANLNAMAPATPPGNPVISSAPVPTPGLDPALGAQLNAASSAPKTDFMNSTYQALTGQAMPNPLPISSLPPIPNPYMPGSKTAEQQVADAAGLGGIVSQPTGATMPITSGPQLMSPDDEIKEMKYEEQMHKTAKAKAEAEIADNNRRLQEYQSSQLDKVAPGTEIGKDQVFVKDAPFEQVYDPNNHKTVQQLEQHTVNQLGFTDASKAAYFQKYGRLPGTGTLVSPFRPGQTLSQEDLDKYRALPGYNGVVRVGLAPEAQQHYKDFIDDFKSKEKLPELPINDLGSLYNATLNLNDQVQGLAGNPTGKDITNATSGFVKGVTLGNVDLGQVQDKLSKEQENEYANAPIADVVHKILTPYNIGETAGGLIPFVVSEGITGAKALDIAGKLSMGQDLVKLGLGAEEAAQIAEQASLAQRAIHTGAIFGAVGALRNPDPEGRNSLLQNLALRTKAGLEEGATGAFTGALQGEAPGLLRSVGSFVAPSTAGQVLSGASGQDILKSQAQNILLSGILHQDQSSAESPAVSPDKLQQPTDQSLVNTQMTPAIGESSSVDTLPGGVPTVPTAISTGLPEPAEVANMSAADLVDLSNRLPAAKRGSAEEKTYGPLYKAVLDRGKQLWRESLPDEAQTDRDLNDLPAVQSNRNRFTQLFEQGLSYEEILNHLTNDLSMGHIVTQLQSRSDVYSALDRGQRINDTIKLPQAEYDAKLQELKGSLNDPSLTDDQRAKAQNDIAAIEAGRRSRFPYRDPTVSMVRPTSGFQVPEDATVGSTPTQTSIGDSNADSHIPTIVRPGIEAGNSPEAVEHVNPPASGAGLTSPSDAAATPTTEPATTPNAATSTTPTSEKVDTKSVPGVALDNTKVIGVPGTAEATGKRTATVQIGPTAVNVEVPATYTDNETHVAGIEKFADEYLPPPIAVKGREQVLDQIHNAVLKGAGDRPAIVATSNGKEVAIRPFIDDQGKLGFRPEAREPGKPWETLSVGANLGNDYNEAAHQFTLAYGGNPEFNLQDPIMKSNAEFNAKNNASLSLQEAPSVAATEPPSSSLRSHSLPIDQINQVYLRNVGASEDVRQAFRDIYGIGRDKGTGEINEGDIYNHYQLIKSDPIKAKAFSDAAEKLGFDRPEASSVAEPVASRLVTPDQSLEPPEGSREQIQSEIAKRKAVIDKREREIRQANDDDAFTGLEEPGVNDYKGLMASVKRDREALAAYAKSALGSEPAPREPGARILQASEDAGPTREQHLPGSTTLGAGLGGLGDLSKVLAGLPARYPQALETFHNFTNGLHTLFSNLSHGFTGLQDLTTRFAGDVREVLRRELPKYNFSSDAADKVTDAFTLRSTKIADGFQKAHDRIEQMRKMLPKEFLNDERVNRAGLLKTGSDRVISEMMWNAMQAIKHVWVNGDIDFNDKGVVFDRVVVPKGGDINQVMDKRIKYYADEKNNILQKLLPSVFPGTPLANFNDFHYEPLEDGTTRVYLKFQGDAGKDAVAQALTGKAGTKWNDLKIAGMGGTVDHNENILTMLREANDTRIAAAKAQGITPIDGYMHHYATDQFDIGSGFKRKNLSDIEAAPRHVRTGKLFRTGAVEKDFFRSQEKMLQEFAQESAHNEFAGNVLEHLASDNVPEGQNERLYSNVLEEKNKFGKNLVRASNPMLEKWGLNDEDIKNLKAGGHALQAKGIFMPNLAFEMLRGGVGEKGALSRYINTLSEEGGVGGRMIDALYAGIHDLTNLQVMAKLQLFRSGTLDAITGFALMHPAKILEDAAIAAHRRYQGETGGLLTDVKQDLYSYGRAVPREAKELWTKFRYGTEATSLPEHLRHAVLPDSIYRGYGEGQTWWGKMLLPRVEKWTAAKGYFDAVGKRLTADSIIQADADRHIQDLKDRSKLAVDNQVAVLPQKTLFSSDLIAKADLAAKRQEFLNNPLPETLVKIRKIGGEYAFGGNTMNPHLASIGNSAVVKNFVSAFPKFLFKVSGFANQRINPLNARNIRAASLETDPSKIQLGERDIQSDKELEGYAKKASEEWARQSRAARLEPVKAEAKQASEERRKEYASILEQNKKAYLDMKDRHAKERDAAKAVGDKKATAALLAKQKQEYIALSPAAKTRIQDSNKVYLAKRQDFKDRIAKINEDATKDYSDKFLAQMKQDREVYQAKRREDIATINKDEQNKAVSRLVTGFGFWAAYGLNNLFNLGVKGIQHQEDKPKPDPYKFYSEMSIALANDKQGNERQLQIAGASPLTEALARAQLLESGVKSAVNTLRPNTFDTSKDPNFADFWHNQVGSGPLTDVSAKLLGYTTPTDKTKSYGQMAVDTAKGAAIGAPYLDLARKLTDESARQTPDIGSSLRNSLPGFSNSLQPKIDPQTGQVQSSTAGSELGNLKPFDEQHSLLGMLGNKLVSGVAKAVSPFDIKDINKQEKESYGGPGELATKASAEDIAKLALQNRTTLIGGEAKQVADLTNQKLAAKQAVRYQTENAIKFGTPPTAPVPVDWQKMRQTYLKVSAEGKNELLRKAAIAGGYDLQDVSRGTLNEFLRANKLPAQAQLKAPSEEKTVYNSGAVADEVSAVDAFVKSDAFGNLYSQPEVRLGNKSEQDIAKAALTKIYNRFKVKKDISGVADAYRSAIKNISPDERKELADAPALIIQSIKEARKVGQ